jgi:hypothetical protein
MADAKHLYLVVDNFVYRDVGPRGEDQFTGILRQADPALVREFPQAGDRLINGFAPRAGPRQGYLCECSRLCAPDRQRPWSSTEPASGLKHALDAGDDFGMFEQLAPASRSPAFLDCLDEPGVVFQHPVHGLHDELRGLSTGAVSKVVKTGFLLWRQLDFHRFPFQLNAFSLGEAGSIRKLRPGHKSVLRFEWRPSSFVDWI